MCEGDLLKALDQLQHPPVEGQHIRVLDPVRAVELANDQLAVHLDLDPASPQLERTLQGADDGGVLRHIVRGGGERLTKLAKDVTGRLSNDDADRRGTRVPARGAVRMDDHGLGSAQGAIRIRPQVSQVSGSADIRNARSWLWERGRRQPAQTPSRTSTTAGAGLKAATRSYSRR